MGLLHLRRSRAVELFSMIKPKQISNLPSGDFPPPAEIEVNRSSKGRPRRGCPMSRHGLLKPLGPPKPRMAALAMIKCKIPEIKKSRNVTLVKKKKSNEVTCQE